MTRRAGCQKATTELSLRDSQSLSHLRYPTDTRQLTSPQGEADGVSDGGMTLQALGEGEFALRLVSRQRVAPLYWRSRTHTHTYVRSHIWWDPTCQASFKQHANEGGVTINSYWADNKCFAEYGFQQAVKDCNQKITYCAVGAHYQNGIVEQKIKELTLITQMLILPANHHWPDYVTMMMWPFALKEAAYQVNWLSLQSDGCSCEATFYDADKRFIDPLIHHTFGLPCFVLDSHLQSGVGDAPIWEPRSHLGTYVGHSSSHAGLVALILNHG